MNIAVLGSNCKFSSDLAIQLNRRKKSSLVYRYDALADFKKTFPLYRSLTNKERTHDRVERLNVDVPQESRKDIIALGEYLGDVETQFINNKDKYKEEIKMLNTAYATLNMPIKDDSQFSYADSCVLKKVKEMNRNTELFASNTLNIINVFSGIITCQQLAYILSSTSLLLIVKVKNGDSFIPCEVTNEQLEEIKQKHLQVIILEVSSLDELFKNNFIISTFNLEKEKIDKIPPKEEKPQVETRRGVILNMAEAFNARRILEMEADAA